MGEKLSRRKFVQHMVVGTLTVPVMMDLLTKNLMAQSTEIKYPIIWLQGQSSGIHRSGIMNFPGFYSFIDKHFKIISIESPDLNEVAAELSEKGNQHILILDGYFSDDLDDPINNLLKDLIVISRAVILLGNEASYSAKKPDGFLNLETELLHLVETPFFKLPGNPVPIRHLVGSLNHMILYDFPKLDELRRPTMFYSQKICERCQYRGDFERGNFVREYGEKEGCLYWLGCKGPVTYNSCAVDKWNETSSWCVGVGSPCTGCSEPDFPENAGLGLYGQISSDTAPINSFFVRNASTLAQGAFGVTIAGIAIHAFSRQTSSSMKDESQISIAEKENE